MLFITLLVNTTLVLQQLAVFLLGRHNGVYQLLHQYSKTSDLITGMDRLLLLMEHLELMELMVITSKEVREMLTLTMPYLGVR